MAVFSTDQNRQFYVCRAYKTGVSNLTTIGDVTLITDKDTNIHLQQKGIGGLVKTDYIDKANILSINASAPIDMAKKLKKATVSIDSDNIIPGEDYVLRINFRQLYGMSDEDIYQKYGCVAGTNEMATNSDEFYYVLAQSLLKNFKRCFTPLLGISLDGGTTLINSLKKTSSGWKVNGTEAVAAGSDIEGITFVELPQTSEYNRGTSKLETLNFEIFPTTIYKEGEEIVWGIVEYGDSTTTIGNGYDTADLEYFCMGERGDQYRMKNWPNNIETKYLTDTNETYYYLDIVYAYKGDCEDIQNSKKMITIVSPTKAEFDKLIAALKATGVAIKSTSNYTVA